MCVPPAFLMPAHAAITIMVPIVIVRGILTSPSGSLLGVMPSMPIVAAIPITVAIAESDAATRANCNRNIVCRRRLAHCGHATEQAERDKRYLHWAFHD